MVHLNGGLCITLEQTIACELYNTSATDILKENPKLSCTLLVYLVAELSTRQRKASIVATTTEWW